MFKPVYKFINKKQVIINMNNVTKTYMHKTASIFSFFVFTNQLWNKWLNNVVLNNNVNTIGKIDSVIIFVFSFKITSSK